MRGGREQAVLQRHRAIDADDDGNAASSRLGAEIDTKGAAAALDEDRPAIGEQCVTVWQLHAPQSGIAIDRQRPLARGLDQDRGDRRGQAGHAHDVRRVDAFTGHLFENEAARRFPCITHRSCEGDPATEPRDGDRSIERVAAADLGEMRGVGLAAARGHGLDAKGEVAHGNADAKGVWRGP
ncbi:hypothetical protein ABIB07_005091 [Bradyrhizobium sp. RT10b]